MNLLIDGTALSTTPKGVGRYSYQLIDQLLRRLDRNWSLSVIVFDGELPRFEHGSNISFVRLPRLSEMVKGLAAIPFVAFRTRADVVLMPMEAVAITIGRPIISVLHDIDAMIVAAGRYEEGVFARLMKSVKQFFRVRTLRCARAVICNSAFIAQAAGERYGLKPDRISIGYCGVDEGFYDEGGVHVSEWCEAARSWDGYVLTFATGDSRERYDLCPAIWQLVRADYPKTGLIIAGVHRDQNYVAELKNEFSVRGFTDGRDYALVDFMGEKEFGKLRSLYRDADFYLELSGHEGFGMQLAEAMAAGTTCISSGRGALAEVGSIYAINFDRLEPSWIAEKIVLSYRESSHLRDNRSQVEYTKQFSWDMVGAVVARKLTELRKGVG